MSEIFVDVPAWPETAAPAEAGPGHNKPPVEVEVKAAFAEELLRERPDFMTKFDDVLAAEPRIKIESDDDLARGAVLEKTIRAVEKHIEAVHGTVKAPWLAGSRAADAERKALVNRLDPVKVALKNKMNRYVADREAKRRAEQARIEAEERARSQQAEQAWAEEAVPVAGRTEGTMDRIVRADEGASVSGQTVWKSEVLDYSAAFEAVKSDPKVREAIEASVARLVRAGQREIPGARVWQTAVARTR